jgi:hypothetical protein
MVPALVVAMKMVRIKHSFQWGSLCPHQRGRGRGRKVPIGMKICRRVVATAVLGLSLSAQAAPVINQATGLSAPDTLIDFGMGLFPTGTDIANNFASDGVTFGSTYEYLDVGDFGPSVAFGSLMNDNNNSSLNQPGVILFVTDVSAAVFSWRTLSDTTTFSAFLDGSLVESFTAVSNDDTPAASGKFYGFTDIVFDEIRLSILPSSGASPAFAFTLDNLQYNVASVCVQPPPGLISWWDGDGDARDIQDGNDGTLQGGATFAPGFVTSGTGQALGFDGVDDYVSIAHSDNLNVTSHTIEAWIRPPSFVPSGFLTILSKTTPAPVERTFGLFIERAGVPAPRTPGALVGSFTNGPNNFMVLSGNTVVTDGNFHHVAVTYDAPSGTMRLYVDGNLDGETMFAPGTLPDTHTLPASIGADLSLPAGNAQLFFNGLIDELGLYNRALSASEIQGIFLAGSAGKCNGQAPPAAPTVDLVDASDTGTSNTDNITNDTTPTFEGTAPPESIVELFADGGSLDTTVTDASGAWSFTTALDEGIHTMTATATDALGQVSDPSAPLVVTIDTTEPSLTASLTPAPNANGWNNTDVTVSFACTDTLSGVAGSPPTPVIVSTEGTHTVTGSCEDVAGNTAEGMIVVNLDKTPPLIVGLPVFGCTLWPPNHRLVLVGMVNPSDGLAGIATESLTAVSNEPEDGKGDGHTAPDIVIKDGNVKVRAERSGHGDGRVYTIRASATDLAGNTTTATATCEVPHDRGKGKEEKKKKEKKQHKKKHKRK